MSKGVLMAGSLVLGAAGGFAAALLFPSAAPAPLPSVPAGPPRAVPLPDLGRIERRLDELSAAVGSRNAAPATPDPGAKDAGPADAPPDAPLSDRVAALERRLAALEKGGMRQGPAVPEDLAALSTKDLDGLARTLVQSKRYDDAQRVLREILARTDLDDEQRTEMEMQMGYSLRGMGKFSESEARFLETLARVGEDSEKGAWAGFQVGWDRYYQKDPAGASARMERSANAAGVSPIVRVHSLYNAANFAKEAGDTARARVLLERLLNDHAGDIPAVQANMKTQAEAWLKELRGN